MVAPATPLFPDSAAATPSSSPLPKFADLGDVRLENRVDPAERERRRCPAYTRNGAHNDADQAAAHDSLEATPEVGIGGAAFARIEDRLLAGDRVAVIVQNLRQGEQANQHRNEAQPGHKIGIAEYEPVGAVNQIKPDRRKNQAEPCRDKTFRKTITRNAGDNGQRKGDQGEIFRRSKTLRKLRERAGKQNEGEIGAEIGETGGIERHVESPAGLAFAGQRIAVENRA